MNILQRLYNVARAHTLYRIQNFQKSRSQTGAWERDQEAGEWEQEQDFSEEYQNYKSYSEKTAEDKTHYSGVPRQVVEDLGIFNLKPPSSLEEVRRARNREIKKYHSDRFMNDPEKLKTSKEIMQIYNAAYDRLKEYYK